MDPIREDEVEKDDDEEGLPRGGDRIGDKYVVEGMIGRGGMGAVFSARNDLTGRRVAIKWILPFASTRDIEQRLMREARAMGLIEHPNVIQVLDLGRDDRSLFLVMEHLSGKSMRELTEDREVEPEHAIRLLLPAMSGIAAAHAAGVIHRDLKPENLFVCLDEEGRPFDTKVLDFGISKILTPAGDDTHKITRTGTTVGTPAYMSPQQVLGGKIDTSADVYALGVILYELLSARLPYEAETYNALVIQIATGDPMPLRVAKSGLDPALEAVVERAMAKDSESRYPDVGSFARALEPFAGGAKFVPGKASVKESARISDVKLPPPTERKSGLRTVLGGADALGPTMARASADVPAIAASAIEIQPVRRSRWPLFAALGALLVAGIGGSGYYALVVRPAAEAATQATQEPTAPVAPTPNANEEAPTAAELGIEVTAPPPGIDPPQVEQPAPVVEEVSPAERAARERRRARRLEREGATTTTQSGGRSGTISSDDF